MTGIEKSQNDHISLSLKIFFSQMSFMIQQSTQTHSQEVRKMWGHIYLHVADFVK